MSGVSVKSFMVFLSLENVDQISSLDSDASDIEDLIFSFLLMIWWVWDLELLLVPLIIYLHETKLGKAVLKTYSI